jgi:hypothetical protein
MAISIIIKNKYTEIVKNKTEKSPVEGGLWENLRPQENTIKQKKKKIIEESKLNRIL